jgi:hypothetical protein
MTRLQGTRNDQTSARIGAAPADRLAADQNVRSASATHRRLALVAALVLVAATAYLVISFGMAPLFIVGIPGVLAWLLWYSSYLRLPTDPDRFLPAFLVTIAGFGFHAIEEFHGHYGPAVGRLFGFAWTDEAFVIIVLALISALCLVSIGLYRRVALAGFVAIVFLMTRLAEVALFVFPLLPPAIQPDNPQVLSEQVSGTLVLNMPSYYVGATGSYYFPGMYTVVLPILPAIVSLWLIWRFRRTRSA